MRPLADFQPAGQCLLWPAGPFGHAGQTFAPEHVIRCLANGRGRHAPSIFKFAVFQKHFVAERVGLVVKRDAGAAGFAQRVDLAKDAFTPGAGKLQGLPLPVQRQLQQASYVTVSEVGPTGGTGQVGHQVKRFRVVGE